VVLRRTAHQAKNENIQFFRGPIMKINIAMLVIPPFVMMFLMLIFMVL